MKLYIEIQLGNDAMQTGADAHAALARFPRGLSPLRAADEGLFFDANGNAVGRWDVLASDSETVRSYMVETTEPGGGTHITVVEAVSSEHALERVRDFDPEGLSYALVPEHDPE